MIIEHTGESSLKTLTLESSKRLQYKLGKP